MAKLKRTVPIKDVTDDKCVSDALAEVAKTCKSGLLVGDATLVLHFDAPSLETARRKREDGEDDDEPVPAAAGARK